MFKIILFGINIYSDEVQVNILVFDEKLIIDCLT